MLGEFEMNEMVEWPSYLKNSLIIVLIQFFINNSRLILTFLILFSYLWTSWVFLLFFSCSGMGVQKVGEAN